MEKTLEQRERKNVAARRYREAHPEHRHSFKGYCIFGKKL